MTHAPIRIGTLSFSVSKTMPRNRSLHLSPFFSTPTDHESIGPSPISDHSGGMGFLAGPLMDIFPARSGRPVKRTTYGTAAENRRRPVVSRIYVADPHTVLGRPERRHPPLKALFRNPASSEQTLVREGKGLSLRVREQSRGWVPVRA